MEHDERTVDELIELAEEIPERLGLAEGMAGLRGRASGDGVSVTVDVQGKLVGLEIDDQGIALGPDRLAARIAELSAEAGNDVLQAGMRAVQAGSTPAIAGAIADFLGVTDRPRPPVAEETERPARPSPRPARRDDDEEEGFVLKPVG
ncbi:hypothetical protein ACFWY9_30125 [Amycolatopsis sp. NPDC059027]|uniref:hypothetical protein n=1 Tax=Amycolatopsis sp. NPDC059027 TaxID=3346709 RepID=UPI00367031B1